MTNLKIFVISASCVNMDCKAVSLGVHFESFVEEGVANGSYKNASEVLRAGLRLLEEEENRLLVLRKAIQEGINSGFAVNFDPKKYLESLKTKEFTFDETKESPKVVPYIMDQFWGVISDKTTEEMHKHITQSRAGWERDI